MRTRTRAERRKDGALKANNSDLCFYCEKNKATCLNHFIPKAKGGSHSSCNLVPCCDECASYKRNRKHTEYFVNKWIKLFNPQQEYLDLLKTPIFKRKNANLNKASGNLIKYNFPVEEDLIEEYILPDDKERSFAVRRLIAILDKIVKNGEILNFKIETEKYILQISANQVIKVELRVNEK